MNNGPLRKCDLIAHYFATLSDAQRDCFERGTASLWRANAKTRGTGAGDDHSLDYATGDRVSPYLYDRLKFNRDAYMKAKGLKETMILSPEAELPTILESVYALSTGFPEFRCALDRASKFVSKDARREILTGVILYRDACGVRLVATDTHRLHIETLPAMGWEYFQAALRPETLKWLLSFSKGKSLSIELCEGEVSVCLDGQGIVHPVCPDTPPHWERILPGPTHLAAKVDIPAPAELAGRLKFAARHKPSGKGDGWSGKATWLIACKGAETLGIRSSVCSRLPKEEVPENGAQTAADTGYSYSEAFDAQCHIWDWYAPCEAVGCCFHSAYLYQALMAFGDTPATLGITATTIGDDVHRGSVKEDGKYGTLIASSRPCVIYPTGQEYPIASSLHVMMPYAWEGIQ